MVNNIKYPPTFTHLTGELADCHNVEEPSQHQTIITHKHASLFELWLWKNATTVKTLWRMTSPTEAQETVEELPRYTDRGTETTCPEAVSRPLTSCHTMVTGSYAHFYISKIHCHSCEHTWQWHTATVDTMRYTLLSRESYRKHLLKW